MAALPSPRNAVRRFLGHPNETIPGDPRGRQTALFTRHCATHGQGCPDPAIHDEPGGTHAGDEWTACKSQSTIVQHA